MKPIRFAALIAILSLTACVETPIQQVAPSVDYSANIITFDVNEKVVLNDTTLTPEAQKLADTYKLSVESALKEWVKNRVQKGGPQGTFYAIIKSVTIVSKQLPVKTGMQGYFNREQAEELIGSIEILFSIEGSARNLPQAEASVKVTASESLPEEASAMEREKAYTSLINRLIAGVDAEAPKQFNQYFSAYKL